MSRREFGGVVVFKKIHAIPYLINCVRVSCVGRSLEPWHERVYDAIYRIPSTLEAIVNEEKRWAKTDHTKDQPTYCHLVDTLQEQDTLIYQDPSSPQRLYRLESTLDFPELLIFASNDRYSVNQIWCVDFKQSHVYVRAVFKSDVEVDTKVDDLQEAISSVP